MSQRSVTDQFVPLDDPSDSATATFVIEKMVGSRMDVESSTDKVLIHRAWVQGDWIAADLERYTADEREPAYVPAEEPS